MLAVNDAPSSSLRLFTIPEVSAALRVSPREIYRSLNSGALASVKIGRLRRVTRAQLEAYIADLERSGV